MIGSHSFTCSRLGPFGGMAGGLLAATVNLWAPLLAAAAFLVLAGITRRHWTAETVIETALATGAAVGLNDAR